MNMKLEALTTEMESNVISREITPRDELMLKIPPELLPKSVPKHIAEMNIDEFLPSRREKAIYLVDSPDLTIWQPFAIEVVWEIGPRRMWVLFFNGMRSLILQYVYQERSVYFLHARGKISLELYEKVLRYLKYRIAFIEKAVTKSIKDEKLPKDHEKILLDLLKEQLDRGFRFRKKNGKNGVG